MPTPKWKRRPDTSSDAPDGDTALDDLCDNSTRDRVAPSYPDNAFYTCAEAEALIPTLHEVSMLVRWGSYLAVYHGLAAYMNEDPVRVGQELVNETIIRVTRAVRGKAKTPWLRSDRPLETFMTQMGWTALERVRRRGRQRWREGVQLVEERFNDDEGEGPNSSWVAVDPDTPESLLIHQEAIEHLERREKAESDRALRASHSDPLARRLIELEQQRLRGKALRDALGLDQTSFDSLRKKVRRRKTGKGADQ